MSYQYVGAERANSPSNTGLHSGSLGRVRATKRGRAAAGDSFFQRLAPQPVRKEWQLPVGLALTELYVSEKLRQSEARLHSVFPVGRQGRSMVSGCCII